MKRAFAALLILLAASSAFLYADDSTLYIDTFDQHISVGTDNVFSVENSFVFNYLTSHHGYYWNIPIGYLRRRIVVDNIQSSETYEISERTSDYIQLQVGDADRTVRGEVPYTLSFDYDLGEDLNEGYDEFYFILLPTRDYAVRHFSFTVSLPKPIENPEFIALTYGDYGSGTRLDSWTLSPDRMTVSGTADNLGGLDMITVRIQLPDGYFTDARALVDYETYARYALYALSVIFVVIGIVLWRKHGRDLPFVPVTRFTPPEDLTPAEVGYLSDGVVDNKDLTSMIFYWADKGCLTIRELEKKDYEFTMVRDLPEESPAFEKVLFAGLFNSGKTVRMKKIGSSFGKVMEAAKDSLQEQFAGEHALKDAAANHASGIILGLAVALSVVFSLSLTANLGLRCFWDALCILFVVVIVLLVQQAILSLLIDSWHMRKTGGRIKGILFFLLLSAVGTGVFYLLALMFDDSYNTSGNINASLAYSLAFTLLGILARISEKRTPYGQKLLEEVVGYRDFIETVEIDRLKMMVDEDPESFYHVLPYAIVLGLEDRWSEKFNRLGNVASPSWYYGDNFTFTDYLIMSSIVRSMNTSFQRAAAPSTSGSPRPGSRFGGSFFGSSGFSGGGFGGGHMGSW